MNASRHDLRERGEDNGPDYDKWEGLVEQKRSIALAILAIARSCWAADPNLLLTYACLCCIACLVLRFGSNLYGILGAIVIAFIVVGVWIVARKPEKNDNGSTFKGTAEPSPEPRDERSGS